MSKKTIIIVISVLLVLGIAGVLLFCSGEDKEATLKVDCNGKNLSGTYHKGDTIECELLGEKYEIKIKSISSDKIKLQANDYGLTPVKDGKIDLNTKVKDFELVKGTILHLNVQATDTSSSISFDWE